MRVTRRQFLKGMGATAAGAGFAGASFNRLIPFLNQPDEIVPGVSTWYATTCRECPAGCGMIVRNRDGHAVKCEGNPLSPLNQGKLCARGQAALMGLYDPDRITGPMRRDPSGKLVPITWDDALKSIGETLAKKPKIALMTDLQTGSLSALMQEWLKAFGSHRFLVYEPISFEGVRATFFGTVPTYHIEKADFLISFGADFLETWISPVEYAAKFAEMRKLKDGKRATFVYVGPRVSMTAANADYRIIVPPGMSATVAKTIISGGSVTVPGVDPQVIAEVAKRFKSAKSPLALPGNDSDSGQGAYAFSNQTSIELFDKSRRHALTQADGSISVESFAGNETDDKIDVLIINGANPVYSLPDSSKCKEALKKVPLVISLSSFMDETASLANIVLPSSTPLESWGDYSPYPDVNGLMQPTMGLLYDTRQTGDILLGMAKSAGLDLTGTFKATSYYQYLRNHWGYPQTGGGSEAEWENLVENGGRWSVSPHTSAAPLHPVYNQIPEQRPVENQIRLWAFPHTYLYDGRGANRRWLQEIPEPVTNGVWGTWAEIHPETAKRLNVSTDDIIEVSYKGEKIKVPAFVWEGVAPNTIAVPIGQGHEKYGRFAENVGANVWPLLTDPSPAVEVKKTGETKWAARINGDDHQYGREIVQTAALGQPFKREKEIIIPLPEGYKQNDFYPGHEYKKHRWVMTVDLDRCIGCHACVAACYAENNLAVVGAEGIERRREMSWIRIDRYLDWKEPMPILFQPMLCQHCDAAPCEPVCPVFAASHNEEGLNMQIYNRCVGTRYCSHNCPYKVRRFNWFDYKWPAPLNYQLNPDVTVRCRGVMEKCTFCIQRIREAEINALRESRDVRDGEIVPACVQTCPTGAFAFGDLKDPNSRVSKIIREDQRAYQVLAELNTKPAIIYLKRIVG